MLAIFAGCRILPQRHYHGHQADPKRMLDAFVRIEDADGVLRFARRYGPLVLCSEGEPLGRDHRGERCASEIGPPWTQGAGRIEHWLRWVGEARAILRIKASLDDGQPGRETDWADAVTLGPLRNSPFWGLPQLPLLWHSAEQPSATELANQPLDKQLDLLQAWVNQWLERSDVRPRFGWDDGGGTVSLSAGTFGSLALQLFFMLSGSSTTAVCDGCGTPYLPERKPRSDRMRFCPVCRQNGTAARVQKRMQRVRATKGGQ